MVETSKIKTFNTLIKRDILLNLRLGTRSLVAVFFFLLFALIMALAIGADLPLLQQISPAIIWVGAIFSALMPIGIIFEEDFNDGTIDMVILSGLSPYNLLWSKTISHWITTAFPLIIITPLLAIGLNYPLKDILWLLFSLLLGTPILSLIGTTIAALLLGARRGAIVLIVIVLPLYIPVIIFALSMVSEARIGFDGMSWKMMMAFLFAGFSLLPFAGAAGLKQAISA